MEYTMPRPPKVSLDAVKEAAAQLEASGKKVTVRAVRSIVGAGSFLTLSRYLEELGIRDNESPPSLLPMLPMTEKMDAAIREYIASENSRTAQLELYIKKLEQDYSYDLMTLRVENEHLQKQCLILSEDLKRIRAERDALHKTAMKQEFERREFEKLKVELAVKAKSASEWENRYLAFVESLKPDPAGKF